MKVQQVQVQVQVYEYSVSTRTLGERAKVAMAGAVIGDWQFCQAVLDLEYTIRSTVGPYEYRVRSRPRLPSNSTECSVRGQSIRRQRRWRWRVLRTEYPYRVFVQSTPVLSTRRQRRWKWRVAGSFLHRPTSSRPGACLSMATLMVLGFFCGPLSLCGLCGLLSLAPDADGQTTSTEYVLSTARVMQSSQVLRRMQEQSYSTACFIASLARLTRKVAPVRVCACGMYQV